METIQINQEKKPRVAPEKYKQYNRTYYDKHKGDSPNVCGICFGSYTFTNKNHHEATTRHLVALYLNDLKEKSPVDVEG